MEHLYSGLETEGMKVLKCTLKIQPHWEYQHDILTLPQKRVTVPMDGSDAKNVMFHGCKVMQLALSGGRREGELVMPVSFTIGGPCTYNKEDKKDFEIMMRSKEQSLAMHIPPNGNFDWPDYRAFETCPGCCTRAKASSSGRRYWLLFQPVLQHVYASQNEGQATMAIRMLCRLTCQECLENMTEDKYVEVIQGNGDAAIVNVPLLDVIEEQGPITWLSDGQMRVRSINEDTCLNAYTLYQTWENTGTWQSLSDNFGEKLQGAMEGANLESTFISTKNPSHGNTWQMDQIPQKDGKVCDGPNCSNIHGKRTAPEPGEKKGRRIRLQECTGCFVTMYCCSACQSDAWSDHKVTCKEVQRERKEEEEKKREHQKLDDEARMEAARASFVPLSITPQGPGKKKKSKKGGGKKKKGKK